MSRHLPWVWFQVSVKRESGRPCSICRRRLSLVKSGLNLVSSTSDQLAASVRPETPPASSKGRAATTSMPDASTVCRFEKNRTAVKLLASLTPAFKSVWTSAEVRLNRLVNEIRSSITIR